MNKELVDSMTLQEACDFAVQSIVEQGGQCGYPDPAGLGMTCEYSSSDGKHCAVGWLLDDTNKDLMKFGGDVGSLICEFEEEIPELIKYEVEVFRVLQNFHDNKFSHKRSLYRNSLEQLGIDTSKPQYQDWIDLGE